VRGVGRARARRPRRHRAPLGPPALRGPHRGRRRRPPGRRSARCKRAAGMGRLCRRRHRRHSDRRRDGSGCPPVLRRRPGARIRHPARRRPGHPRVGPGTRDRPGRYAGPRAGGPLRFVVLPRRRPGAPSRRRRPGAACARDRRPPNQTARRLRPRRFFPISYGPPPLLQPRRDLGDEPGTASFGLFGHEHALELVGEPARPGSRRGHRCDPPPRRQSRRLAESARRCLVDRLLVEEPGGSRGQAPWAVQSARPRRRRTSGSGT
jgi:hypothetical protein